MSAGLYMVASHLGGQFSYLGITCPSSSGLSFSSAISNSVWLSSSSGVEGWGLLPKRPRSTTTNQHLFHGRAIPTPKPQCVFSLYGTCTKISTRAASVSLQQHTLWRHLCAKSSLDVVNEILTVRTVYPDSFPQRVLNVNLQIHFR